MQQSSNYHPSRKRHISFSPLLFSKTGRLPLLTHTTRLQQGKIFFTSKNQYSDSSTNDPTTYPYLHIYRHYHYHQRFFRRLHTKSRYSVFYFNNPPKDHCANALLHNKYSNPNTPNQPSFNTQHSTLLPDRITSLFQPNTNQTDQNLPKLYTFSPNWMYANSTVTVLYVRTVQTKVTAVPLL